MSHEEQPPGLSHPSGSQPSVKLRSACDACSVAKVKCDKKQPVCDRCSNNNFSCFYSPSRRHGKQSWAKRAAPHRTTTPRSSHSLFGLNTMSSFEMTSFVSTPFASTPFLGLTPASSEPSVNHPERMDLDNLPPEYSDLPGINSLGHGLNDMQHWTQAETTRNLEASESHILPNSQIFFGNERVADGSNISSSLGSEPHPLEPVRSFASESTSLLHDCEGKAFAALYSLYYGKIVNTPGPGGLSYRIPSAAASNYLPSLDKVLHFNKAALSTLKELLDCPCAHQPHLALVYMSILTKVLFWYQLLVSGHYSVVSGDSGHGALSHDVPEIPTSSSGPQSHATDRVIQPAPIQIGVFDLEEEDQVALMRGVLLREVRKIEPLVNRIASLGRDWATGHADDTEMERALTNMSWYGLARSKARADLQNTIIKIRNFGTNSPQRDG